MTQHRHTIVADREIQNLLDEMRATLDPSTALLGNARTNPHKARVAQFFKERRFPAAYATSFWIAFSHGVSFSRSLHQYRPA